MVRRLIFTVPQVVNVSSVTHRYGWVGDVRGFLPSWRPGSYYPSTKLVGGILHVTRWVAVMVLKWYWVGSRWRRSTELVGER